MADRALPAALVVQKVVFLALVATLVPMAVALLVVLALEAVVYQEPVG